MTKAKITGTELKITEREPLLAGSVDLNKIEFSFSGEWSGLIKQIDFTNEQGGQSRRISAQMQVCTVPWELLRTEGDISCYVRGIGADGKLKMRTNEANLGTVLGSAQDDVPGSASPTPEVCDELAAKIGEPTELETEAKDNLVAAVNEVKHTADSKQDRLIAGDNITIAADGKTISAAGGGAGAIEVALKEQNDGSYTADITFAQVKAEVESGKQLMLVKGEPRVFVLNSASDSAIEFLGADLLGLTYARITAMVNEAWEIESVTTPNTNNITEIYTDIGVLDNLKTSDKTHLVAAINEVKQTADAKANAADLAPVATSGSYSDLSDKPTLPSVPTATIEANAAARHTHDNKTLLDSITEAIKTAWNTASEWVSTNGANVLSHLSDGAKHITAAERSAWNGKQDKLIAGDNITIAADGKTISATGGNSGGVEVPTRTSELENDSGFVTASELAAELADKQDTISDLEAIRTGASKGATALQSVPSSFRKAAAQDVIDSGKVDKVTGKGLSSNDYTDAAKAKVDAIPANPQYTDTVYDDAAVKGRVSALESKLNGSGAVTFSAVTTDSLTTEGEVEIYGTQPHIDFHYNNSSDDYTSRIIETANGQLNLSAANGVRINGKKTENEAVTLTADSSRITNVSYTAQYNELLGAVFVRIYGTINASLNVGYDYDLFSIGSRLPNSIAALSVKCGKNAMAVAKAASGSGAIQIRPLESGIQNYDVYITGFWFV